MDLFVRVLIVPLIAAMAITTGVIIANLWEEPRHISTGFAVSFFAGFFVAIVQYLSHNADTQKAIQKAEDRMRDWYFQQPA